VFRLLLAPAAAVKTAAYAGWLEGKRGKAVSKLSACRNCVATDALRIVNPGFVLPGRARSEQPGTVSKTGGQIGKEVGEMERRSRGFIKLFWRRWLERFRGVIFDCLASSLRCPAGSVRVQRRYGDLCPASLTRVRRPEDVREGLPDPEDPAVMLFGCRALQMGAF
jgi:hypothetical protein